MKPNIFLITVDALKADYILSKNSVIHPFLSSLMDESIVFEKAVSPAGGTAPSFKGLFSELSPNHLHSEHGYNIPKDVDFLPAQLQQMGYHTIGVSNNAHLTRIQGYDRGFDVFYDGLGENKNQEEKQEDVQKKTRDIKRWIMSFLDENLDIRLDQCKSIFGRVLAKFNTRGYKLAESMNDIAKRYIENYEGDKPLFVWIHYMEVHSPYTLSESYFSKINEKPIPLWERQWLRHQRHSYRRFSESELTDEDMEKIKTLYKCGIRKVDEAIEDFYNYLDKKNLLNDSKFIVTSDHGENLSEWDMLSHRSLYNSVLHVPLLIYGGDEKKTVKDVFGNLDLMDLVLDSIDKNRTDRSISEYTGDGISEVGGRTFTIQNNDYKIIKNIESNEIDIYRLVDFKEKEIENISSEDLSQIKKLEKKLADHIQKIKSSEKSKIQKALKDINISDM